MLERGLKDLSVELSNRDIIAGNPFAIYVLVKNPFNAPVYIQRVHVSLPNELTLDKRRDKNQEPNSIFFNLFYKYFVGDTIRKYRAEIYDKSATIVGLQDEIKELENVISKLNQGLKEAINESTRSSYINSQEGISHLSQLLSNTSASIQEFSHTRAVAQTIELESSLPPGAMLQPGSTVIYTAILFVKNSLIFLPSKYRLQFNISYIYQDALAEEKAEETTFQDNVFSNTVAHEISIRSSVSSVISGAVIGGFCGAFANLIQFSFYPGEKRLELLFKVFLAIILSSVSVIFMARKSDSQSFISIEDFWGGILIGFLVGYSGLSFFEQFTGVQPEAFPEGN